MKKAAARVTDIVFGMFLGCVVIFSFCYLPTGDLDMQTTSGGGGKPPRKLAECDRVELMDEYEGTVNLLPCICVEE